jgi:polyisoprenoid-binding protein YceI
MAIPPGTYTFGPENAELVVLTTRTGAAAKAGHDLTIDVTSWSGTLQIGEDNSVALDADGGSLRVRDGTGGMTALGDNDKAGISQTIDEDVLKRTTIEYRSGSVVSDGDRMRVRGELKMLGKTIPTEFDLALGGDGRLTGSATVRQTDLGLKPYSILFGTLKVTDEVRITIDANLAGQEQEPHG